MDAHRKWDGDLSLVFLLSFSPSRPLPWTPAQKDLGAAATRRLLLYTSDAADDFIGVDLGGRRLR